MTRKSLCLFAAAAALPLVVAAMVSQTGCDPNAKATSSDNTAADRLSNAYETCATTSDCAGDLRCFDSICRVTKASVVGDYNAAVGALALSAGDTDAAIKAYTDAVNRYESDKVDLPLSVLCGKGRALTAGRDDRKQAEEAARTLHQCLNTAPVGSDVRRRALADLAILGGSGLDPELLGRDELQREYLTLQPAGPSSSDVQVKVSGTAKAGSRGHDEALQVLQGKRDALIPCWETNNKANKQDRLAVTVQLRSKYQQGEYEEDDGYRLVIGTPEPAAGTPERCVYDVVKPAVEEWAKANRKNLKSWDSDVTVALE